MRLACAVVLTFSVTLLAAIAVDNRTGPTPSSAAGLLRQDQSSYLTGAGIEEIRDSRRARFDLRDRALTNAESGLSPEHSADAIIGSPGDHDIQMTLVGPDGEETTTTQTIWTVHFGVAGKFKFDYLTFWRAFYSAEAAQQELSAVTARWGIHPDSVTTWNSIAANAGDQKEKFSLGSGVSPTGLVIDMNASTKNGVQVFQYFVDLDERRYTPENLASIRATGDDL